MTSLGPKIFVVIIVACCLASFELAAACEQVPAGETFSVRLLQPVSSYSSKPGDPVRGILIDSPKCDGFAMLPRGAMVKGSLESVTKVGLGFHHGIAALGIGFETIQLKDEPAIDVRARVIKVDNGRERVKNGVIYGIQSTNAPQDRLTGNLQYLTGLHPASLWILPLYRAIFPVMPEPELYFPAGTDLILQLLAPVHTNRVYSLAAGSTRKPAWNPSEQKAIEKELLAVPEQTTTLRGENGDVVNLAFTGSRAQLEEAFEVAGWHQSESMSARTALREIDAFLLLKNYPEGPMAKQLLAGQPSDSTWEKGLDTLAKRDHLRIWRDHDTWLGKPIWISASTRETGAALSIRKWQFIHHVDPNIDDERGRVVRDLMLAGCVSDLQYAPRPVPATTMKNPNGDAFKTDGAVAVIQLKDCGQSSFDYDFPPVSLPSRPHAKLVRYIRTQVLSFRNLWRENAFYGGFALSRQAIRATYRYARHRDGKPSSNSNSDLALIH